MLSADGWLDTGDQAAIRDGVIHITGRLKDIIVLGNGEKVPPVDMELAIQLEKVVSLWNANSASPAYQAIFDAYKKKYGATTDPYSMGIRLSVDYLARAMEKAKSTDPAKVASAIEGVNSSAFGMTEMRGSDHQAISPMFVSTFVKATASAGTAPTAPPNTRSAWK